ncbi:MAG: PepSY domain-containing protein [Gammaproteobacteria bacterium]
MRGENQLRRWGIAGNGLTAVRPALVLLHRYVGLVMAGFLLIAGLTGSLLAWNDELEAVLSPQLFRAAPPAPDAQALDPLVLRAHVAGHYQRPGS